MPWRPSFPMQVGMAFAVGFIGLLPVVGDRIEDRVGASDRAGSEGVVVAGAGEVRSPLDDVVRVRNDTCGGGELTGTGTVLDDGRILTAAHVVAGARQVTIEPYAGVTVTAIDTAVGDDVAILTLGESMGPGIGRPLASSDPPVGPTLLSLAGHPDGGEERTRLARVRQYLPGRDATDPPTLIRLDIESHPGDSGGPVLEAGGSVVGLVLSRESMTGLALVAPVSIVRAGIGSAIPQAIPAC